MDMPRNQSESLYDTLTRGGTDVPPSQEEFSLEEILAEYGGSLEDQLLREADRQAAEASNPDACPGQEPAAAPELPEKQRPPAAKAPPAPPEPVKTAPPPADEPTKRIPDLPPDAGRRRVPPKTDPPKAPEAPPEPPAEAPADVPPEAPGEAPTEASGEASGEAPAVEIPDTGTAAGAHEDPVQAAEAAAAIDVEQLDLPESPRPISLEEVVNSTVEAVMEERQEPILRQRPRWGLFSRKRLEDSERLPPPPEPEPEYDPEPIGPEPDLRDAAAASRKVYLKRKTPRLLPLLPALVPTVLLLAERRGLAMPQWSGEARTQSVVLLVCLLTTAVLCRQVFARAFEMLRRRRVTAELLVSLSALAAAADCASRLWPSEARSGVTPYAAVSCLGLVFALWGVRRESQGTFDMFRCAALDDEPPYLVTDTRRGACKQRGSVPGFFTAAMRDDVAALWQTALLPVFGAAAFVFAGLSSYGQERGGDFLLHLSALLPAAATYSLPLCWSLPWSRVSARLQKNGAAVAGWSGAQKISRRRAMIVTDGDLFPPGTLQCNGRKLFGEEPVKAVAYAASMARAAGCGLEFLFRNLLRAENGRFEEVSDFSFYEEGGYSGVIHGESVLMGTYAFLRKMEIRMPGGNMNLNTGIFLAVDRHLVAVFAVKYNPAENVDFALKLMRRCHILPILATRDPNITPALVRRKFGKAVKLEYPDLSERIALSEAGQDRDLPRALLFREGLLPYAEAVAGSQRLCGAVRRGTALSLLGGWLGTLLVFYLLTLGAYALLNPLALEAFLLLWTLPILLLSDGAGKY